MTAVAVPVLCAINAVVFALISVGGLYYKHQDELDTGGEILLALTIALTVFNFAAVFAS